MSGEDEHGKAKPKGAQGKVQVIDVPHSIKSKVSGGGDIDPKTLVKAEKAVAKLSVDFPDWAANDIERMQKTLASAERNPAERARYFTEIFDIAHELRGQGGSLGYPLMTRIGNSLCRFTGEREALGEALIEVIRAHINAMRAVISNKVTGDGGDVGRGIAQGLEALVKRHTESARETSPHAPR